MRFNLYSGPEIALLPRCFTSIFPQRTNDAVYILLQSNNISIPKNLIKKIPPMITNPYSHLCHKKLRIAVLGSCDHVVILR